MIISEFRNSSATEVTNCDRPTMFDIGSLTDLELEIARSARVDEHGVFRTSQIQVLSGAGSEKALTRYSIALLHPELPWGVAQSTLQHLQGRRFLRLWESIVALSCLYVGFSVPIAVGFAKVYFPDGMCAVAQRKLVAWEIAYMCTDILCDVIFIIDIIVQFFCAVWIVSRHGF